MSRKVRERAALKWFGSYFAKFDDVPPAKFDIDTASRFIDGIVDYLEPQIMRTADEKMAAARDKMLEAIGILEEGAPLNVRDAMKTGGLDPKNRSDIARTRLFLKECGLLQYTGGEPERWTKRITGPTPVPQEEDGLN